MVDVCQFPTVTSHIQDSSVLDLRPHLTVTSAKLSSPCAVVSLAPRHLVPHGYLFCAHQHTHLERPALQRHCQHLSPCNGVAGTCTAGARGICWSVGEMELGSLPVCCVQPLPVVVCPSLIPDAVLPFLRGIPLSDLVVVSLLEFALHPGHPWVNSCTCRTVSETHSWTVLFQWTAWEGVLRQGRGHAHATLPWVELPPLACV